MGDTSPAPSLSAEVELRNTLMAVKHLHLPVDGRGPHGDPLAGERAADLAGQAAEADGALRADLAHLVARPVLDRPARLGERPRAGRVPRGRDRQSPGLVRAVVVVDPPPGVERRLARRRVAEAARRADHLGLARAVEPLLPARGPRVAGPPARHAQA